MQTYQGRRRVAFKIKQSKILNSGHSKLSWVDLSEESISALHYYVEIPHGGILSTRLSLQIL